MNRNAIDELKQRIPLLEYAHAPVGKPPGASAAAGSWACVPCTTIIIRASWWTLAGTCFTAMAARVAAM